ncbi:CDP-alcohol phosphatidyltransferase family protein [Pseudotenacibaculum sp. MALMAid0570]|uniref:CDP-alcohol phosphatidyltransferase family protein n=1 Tax=Pseudotenacibaculum sp. MALMAid0570 TaxID=3143938 RepID=UPI0032DECD93
MRYSYKSVKESFHNQEPWLNVLLLKYITMPMVYFIINYTKITPNFISIISLIFGVLSAYLYFTGEIFLAAISYFISYIFDALDGKVARLTKKGKVYGAWLDIFIDRINLVLISTAISYNFYSNTEDIRLLFLNSIFLGLVFIGSESRHHINLFKSKESIKEKEPTSNFKIWCKQRGLIYEPISLVEIIIFYLIVAPLLNIELYSCVIIIFFLGLRIIKQQLFWINASKS